MCSQNMAADAVQVKRSRVRHSRFSHLRARIYTGHACCAAAGGHGAERDFMRSLSCWSATNSRRLRCWLMQGIQMDGSGQELSPSVSWKNCGNYASKFSEEQHVRISIACLLVQDDKEFCVRSQLLHHAFRMVARLHCLVLGHVKGK